MKIKRKEQKTTEEYKKPDYVGYKHPPVKYRWQKGQTGNPHGRPKVLHDKLLLLLAIKFFDLLARAYYQKGDAPQRIRKIEQIIYAKKVLPPKEL